MVAFTDRLVEANRAVWAAMAGHPFVLGLADGTLPDGALQAWLQQDRIFVVQERRVVAALRAHGLPSRLDDLLADLDRRLVLEAAGFPPNGAHRRLAPRPPPPPADLLADLDRSLVLEAEAFTRTAADRGFAPDAEPWPVCLGYCSYLRCAAYDGVPEGLTALYAAERAYLDTWTAVAELSPADSAYHAWIQNWSGEAVRGL